MGTKCVEYVWDISSFVVWVTYGLCASTHVPACTRMYVCVYWEGGTGEDTKNVEDTNYRRPLLNLALKAQNIKGYMITKSAVS